MTDDEKDFSGGGLTSDDDAHPQSLKGRAKRRPKLRAHRPQIDRDVHLQKGDIYVLLDVGGGTCDVACHEMMGEFSIAEVLHPSGGPWGSILIDREFELMLDDIFSEAWMAEFKRTSPSM